MKQEVEPNTVCVVDLGRTEYERCWDLQRRVFRLRGIGSVPDVLLLTEHNHVYTIGRSGDPNHLLENEDALATRGVRVYYNDRGGDITYHGPGQSVGYPIFDLRHYYLDLHRYLRDLEEVIIRVIHHFGLVGGRLDGYTGVWVEGEKICAIGIKSNHWVTMHGFALNVNTDLSYFDRIIPCGIFERGVTSMQKKLGQALDMRKVAKAITGEFETVFGTRTQKLAPRDFFELLELCDEDRQGRGLHEVVTGAG